jgi:hypothetical protein
VNAAIARGSREVGDGLVLLTQDRSTFDRSERAVAAKLPGVDAPQTV